MRSSTPAMFEPDVPSASGLQCRSLQSCRGEGGAGVEARAGAITSQMLLESLVEESPDALIALGLDCTVLHWNRGASVIFGYSREEAVGRTLEELIVPDDAREEGRQQLAGVATLGSLLFETVRRRKDGVLITVDVTVRVVRDDARQPSFLVVNTKDVTQLRKETALGARWKALLECAPDAMVVVDRNGNIALANAQTTTLLGYARSELIGQPVGMLMPERFRASHAAYMRAFSEAPKPRAMGAGRELLARHKDGTEVPVEISLSPLETDEGVLVSSALRDISQRKRTEAALLHASEELLRSKDHLLDASEARFRCFWDSGIVFVGVSDLEGTLVDANEAAAGMLGYTRSELLSRKMRWRDITPPGWQEVDESARAQLRERGVAAPYEKELLRKDGTRLPILTVVAMIDKERVMGIAIDLTRRKAAEAIARAEQSRFQALVENSADGLVLSTEAGQIEYVSPAAARMFGRPVSELVGASFKDFTHPDDFAAALDHRQRLMQGMHVPAMVRRLIRPDGTVRQIEVMASNLLGNPDIGAIASNVRDVTERRTAEHALQRAQRRFSALLDSGILGVIVTEGTGAVIEANDAFLSMLGYTRDELVDGKINWRALTPPEWGDWGARTGEELRLHGRSTPREKEYFRKDGTRVPVLVGVAFVEDTQRIWVSLDLTERKRAEAAIADLESQFRQAQKMEAVGKLAGGVAHDFNNLLTIILSYGELLLEESTPGDSVHTAIEEIMEAGQRAAALTAQLLMFSRHQGFEPRLVDPRALLDGMEKMIRRLIGEDVRLVVSRIITVGKVMADPGLIEQVIMNLVVNARDAMPKGGTLTIETADVVLDDRYAAEHLGAEPGAYVLLAVSDTGIGMDRATQAHVFEPFFTTKEQGKGTGLGLSTVFGIVQQCGGNVWLESEPGVGTSFKVYLPAVQGEADSVPLQQTPATLRGTETILLVEDEEPVRVVARGLLERQGYRVLEARHPEEAIAVSERHDATIDLLLSDVVMPQMNGPDLARRLGPARPGMKVLCMSGYTDDAVLRHGGLDPGMSFLQKPFTRESLTRKVREVLDAVRDETGRRSVRPGA